jgi:hypothetical protein
MPENKITPQDADKRTRDYAISATCVLSAAIRCAVAQETGEKIDGTSHLSEGIKQSGQKILNFGQDDHNPEIINNGRALINLANSI